VLHESRAPRHDNIGEENDREGNQKVEEDETEVKGDGEEQEKEPGNLENGWEGEARFEGLLGVCESGSVSLTREALNAIAKFAGTRIGGRIGLHMVVLFKGSRSLGMNNCILPHHSYATLYYFDVQILHAILLFRVVRCMYISGLYYIK